MNIFISALFSSPTYFWLVTLSVIPSICLHEYVHAQTALWMGDDTAAAEGHLTLNPLKQMGWISLVTFLILGIAWGAVPVERRNLTRNGAVLVSLAGPFTNLLLALFGAAVLCALLVFKAHGMDVRNLMMNYFYYLGLFNIVMFILNMLPVPGLDGWGALCEYVHFRNINSEIIKGSMLFLMLLLIACIHYLFLAASWLMGFVPYFAEKFT